MIDREAFLRPVSAEAPTGEDLAFSDLHDAINEARREDIQGTSTGIWQAEEKRANWDQVIALSTEGLINRSKDLQLAVWLTEGLLYREGIVGFTQGLDLIHALCDKFWDNLYPRIEDGDHDARLAPLLALESRVVPALMLVQLTTGGPGGKSQYNLQNLLNAQRIEPLAASNPKAYKTALDSGDVSMAKITAAASRTETDFYRQLFLDLRGCEGSLRRLSDLLSLRCGIDAPGFTKLYGVIGQLQQTIGRLGAGRLIIEEAPAPVVETVASETPSEALAPVMPAKIASREDAYRYLTEASNYLMTTEPHSPVPYLVKRAIRWGDLPLGTLLTELLEDDERSKRLFKLLSITP